MTTTTADRDAAIQHAAQPDHVADDRSALANSFLAGILHERERAAKVAASAGAVVGCPQNGTRAECHRAIAAAIRKEA